MGEKKLDAVEFVRAGFDSIWPVHLSGFTRLLIQLRTRFDGDLDLMLVLAVIGERTRPESWRPEPVTYRQMTSRQGEAHLQLPINIQSVSDYTGIPRETVRRKVRRLLEKGWIDRDSEGRLTVSSAAAGELEQSTLQSIDYLAAISGAILAVKARGGPR